MAIKLTAESFLAVVKQSGLIEQERLKQLLSDFQQRGIAIDDSRSIADELVNQNVLTRWQADKLLQAKHKGFFLGKYRLLSLLGKGGMSSVYLAEHVLMRRRCAIKVLPSKRVHDTSYLGRFHREAQAVASLDHPNIVRAYDVDKEVDRDTEVHFLVMEFVEGQSLHEVVARNGVMEYVSAADYIRQAADGLAHAHHAGMVHRDIKPGNLLVDHHGTVKILDLGLARFFDDPDDESLTVAHDEKVLGTADYLAPEQALDSHKVDARADIYSLGCTLYFLLTGHPPFTEGTLAQRLMSHQTKEPPPIENDRPETPPSLLAIIRKMMAKNPDDRFQTAQDVADVIAGWLIENAGDDWKQKHSSLVGSGSLSGSGASQADSSGSQAGGSAGQQATAEPEDADLAAFLTNLNASDSGTSSASSSSAPPQPASSKTSKASQKPNSKPSPPPQAVPVAQPVHNAQDSAGEVNQHAEMSRPAPARAVPVAKPVSSGEKSETATHPGFGEFPVDESAPEFPNFAEPDAPAVQTADHPPVAEGGVAAESYSPGARRRRRKGVDFKQLLSGKGNLVAASLGGLLTVLLAYGAYSMFAGGNGTGGGKSGGSQGTQNGESVVLKPEITVGPGAEFSSIVAALEFLRAHYDPAEVDWDVQTVKVQGGQTYRERLTLNNSDFSYPDGIRLVAEGGRAILAPDGSEPILSLIRMQRFTIRGFDLQADGKPVAVEMSQYLSGTRLEDLNIQGFTQAGVRAEGVSGLNVDDGHVVLQDLRFQTNSSQAIGIKVEQGEYSTSQLKIRNSRFRGPMAAGVHIATDSEGLEIRESIFSGLPIGVQVSGSEVGLAEFTLANNTFYQVDRGLVFQDMPSEFRSRSIVIARNLFAEPKGTEAIVERNYNAEKFTSLAAGGNGIRHNWTSRAVSDSPASGEIDLFSGGGGLRGVGDLKFVSTDPDAPRFLAPSDGSPQKSVDGATGELKPYIGAVGP